MNHTLADALEQLSRCETINAHLHSATAGIFNVEYGGISRDEVTGIFYGVSVQWTEIQMSGPFTMVTSKIEGMTGAYITQEFISHMKRADSSRYEWELVL